MVTREEGLTEHIAHLEGLVVGPPEDAQAPASVVADGPLPWSVCRHHATAVFLLLRKHHDTKEHQQDLAAPVGHFVRDHTAGSVSVFLLTIKG